MEPAEIERHRWESREAEVSGNERVNTRIEPAGSGARWTTPSVGQRRSAGRVESLSGSARVDSTNVLLGELRGQTKLIKITEGVRKYSAEQGISNEAGNAVAAGL